MAPIKAEITRRKKGKRKAWDPELHFTLGNHENRIMRAVDDSAELEDLMSFDDFNLEEHGFKVHDYLDVVTIDGVAYSHFFTSGVMGRPVSSAATMLNKKHMSTVMGHVQDRQIAYAKRADGARITGIFAGIYYQARRGLPNPADRDVYNVGRCMGTQRGQRRQLRRDACEPQLLEEQV